MSNKITLICQFCKKEDKFTDEKAAFLAGWDILVIDFILKILDL